MEEECGQAKVIHPTGDVAGNTSIGFAPVVAKKVWYVDFAPDGPYKVACTNGAQANLVAATLGRTWRTQGVSGRPHLLRIVLKAASNVLRGCASGKKDTDSVANFSRGKFGK